LPMASGTHHSPLAPTTCTCCHLHPPPTNHLCCLWLKCPLLASTAFGLNAHRLPPMLTRATCHLTPPPTICLWCLSLASAGCHQYPPFATGKWSPPLASVAIRVRCPPFTSTAFSAYRYPPFASAIHHLLLPPATGLLHPPFASGTQQLQPPVLPLASGTHHLHLATTTHFCSHWHLLPTIAFSSNAHCLPPATTICLCHPPFASTTCHSAPPLTICLALNTLADNAYHLPTIYLWRPPVASHAHHLPPATQLLCPLLNSGAHL